MEHIIDFPVETGLEHCDRYAWHMPYPGIGLLGKACLNVLGRPRHERLEGLLSPYITVEQLNHVADLVEKNIGLTGITKQACCSKDTVYRVREALKC